MLFIKNNVLERIKNWNNESICILTDFDRTITTFDSKTSWSVLYCNKLVSKEYIEEANNLYEYYRYLEIDPDINDDIKNKYMLEWWTRHINLLIKYKLSRKIIEELVSNPNLMTLRDGAKEILESMYKNNIPIIIISAGIGDIIEKFLIKNDCYFNNIHIISNFLEFEDDIVVGIKGKIIHALNKDDVMITNEMFLNRNNIVLFGDSIDDIKMIKKDLSENALKIGFVEKKIFENNTKYKESFDIVCDDKTSFGKIFSKFSIFK